ncbi:alpha/beta hydrolase [Pseudohongiella spirulinae]|nr:alpha/beta hydrolase [Pseudohongiella spirulinae]
MSSMMLLQLLMTSVVSAQSGNTTEISYPRVAADVTFAQVQSLSASRPARQIAYGDDALQFGELWLPATSAADDAPLVVFIHGGCWLNAYDIGHTHALSTALAQQGFAVWSLEYRRTGDQGGGWPGTLQDIRAGLLAIDDLSAFGVDASRVVLAGHSAGGHLALLAAGDQPFKAVIGLAAITDVIEYAAGSNSCQTATSQFMGSQPEEQADEWRAANPVQQRLHPRTLLLAGDADAIVPLSQAQVAGISTLIQPGAGHFDWVHPGTPAFNLFVQMVRNALSQ